MKTRILPAAFALSFAFATLFSAQTPDAVPAIEVLGIVRTVNTAQVTVFQRTGKFVGIQQLVNSGMMKLRSSELVPIDANSARWNDYLLSVAASTDGKHYQVSLLPEKDKCSVDSAFSNESGIIYVGRPLGCKAPQ